MSRIGKQIIQLEKGMEVSLNPNRQVLVKSGAKSLQIPFPENLELKQEDSKISIVRNKEDVETRSLHGLTRALIQNAVIGLSKGWSKTLGVKWSGL